jgi:hypothetical protein
MEKINEILWEMRGERMIIALADPLPKLSSKRERKEHVVP